MKPGIEFLMLDTIKRHGSIMPLFTAGYAYSRVMEWGKQLEKEGKLIYNENGIRSLTEVGEQRWKLLKKENHTFSILPLEGMKTSKMDIDDIYLP